MTATHTAQSAAGQCCTGKVQGQAWSHLQTTPTIGTTLLPVCALLVLHKQALSLPERSACRHQTGQEGKGLAAICNVPLDVSRPIPLLMLVQHGNQKGKV